MTRKRRTTLPTNQDDGGAMGTKQDTGRPSFDGDDTDVDPVVKTYDVFVSNALKDHIYLLQYPVQDWKQEYTEGSAPLAIKMRPNGGEMEFEVPIDAHNYCPEQGEKFGGQGLITPQDGLPMESQRLGGKPQPNQASYFVGRVRGGMPMFGSGC
jgi:DNA-directed RNA polymerase III subunit RPC5